MKSLDNPVQCKFIPHLLESGYEHLVEEVKDTKWEVETKPDVSGKHRLVKFTCKENRPPKNLFEVRLEMGSEAHCKRYKWVDIPLHEYEHGFNVTPERYQEITTMPFPFLEDRRLEIMCAAHYTPGHTVEYSVKNGYIFVDLNHVTLEADWWMKDWIPLTENQELKFLSDKYSVKYEDGDWLVLKFKTHNERDKYLSNDSEYRKLKDQYGWKEHLGKFFKVQP